MTNPFFTASSLPFELPPFGEISEDHYAPAFEQGMAQHRAEIEEIATDPAPPTFANTLLKMERSGQLLGRVTSVFYSLATADSTPGLDELRSTYAPQFAAHFDAIQLDPRLYARIAEVYAERGSLTPGEQYLVERYYTQYTLAGAGLDEAAKTRLKEINARLSSLTTQFDQRLLADTNDLALVVDDAAELSGLTEGELSAAAAAARDRGLPDKYVISLVLPTSHPYLERLENAETRRRLFEAQRARGGRGNEHDTRQTLLELVRLRAEKARLLGFDSHAAAVTRDNTAGTPEAVRELLVGLAPAAAANARRERAALEERAGGSIHAWDWPFYSEQVRAAEYDVDLGALRPYFEAERVLRDGVFHAATQLFGITFSERTDLVGYHPEVRVFEVREADGQPLGLYLLDLYTRDSKKGGAWMNSLVDQSDLLERPYAVVCNNLNVPKPGPGEPTLLTYDETATFFHEFGHALHGLLAKVVYPRFAGTSVFRDFVEYPSQVNEMWMLWPEVASNYARHHETGEPIPEDVIERLNATSAFNQGYATSEYLAAALLDLAWHSLTPEEAAAVTDLGQFEADALAAVGLDDPAVPSRYYSTYFAHIFAGGYSAAYYSYIWSELLDADTVDWFRSNGGLTRDNGTAYRDHVIGFGGSQDPLESYRRWRGRPAPIEPLLTRRGLAQPTP